MRLCDLGFVVWWLPVVGFFVVVGKFWIVVRVVLLRGFFLWLGFWFSLCWGFLGSGCRFDVLVV
ncbi:hypothetical protein, partial [Pseudomonas syringae group genomosp. 7]|uniref:hypothetical protein n=1 Tax=Pseudomonas syringae group genomosp. 7 TaxID=251699 RepID=UPI00376FDAA5